VTADIEVASSALRVRVLSAALGQPEAFEKKSHYVIAEIRKSGNR